MSRTNLALGTMIGAQNALLGIAYSEKVLATQPANLLAYWMLNETSGLVADNAEGTSARDADYVGTTLGQPGIGDGNTAPYFDKINDRVRTDNASMLAAFNGDEGSMSIWVRIDSDDWTVGRSYAMRFGKGWQNSLYIRLWTSSNFHWGRSANSVNQTVVKNMTGFTGWQHMALTWSKIDDEVKAFLNGVQEGLTLNGLSAFVYPIDQTGTAIGSDRSTSTIDAWVGWLAHAAIWDIALTPAEVLSLATV